MVSSAMKNSAILQITRGGRWAFYTLRSASNTSSVELDSRVHELIESSQLHPKRHPGANCNVNTHLPEDLQIAMMRTFGDVPKKNVLKDASEFSKYLHARRPPMEDDEERELVSSIRKEVEGELKVDLKDIPNEMRDHYKKIIDSKVDHLTKQRKYNWNQMEYTRHLGLVYMASRATREYAVNYQVLKELKNRFNYTPRTVFDFGSGVGSVLWAVDSLWSQSLREAFAVDSSSHMNDISREMLIYAERKHLKKILFQRQFLPMSSTPSYDLVVSSYSLLELPSAQSRLETVLNLWNKTKDFLVLIEFGTTAGFHVINEAKDFLLWGMNKKFAESSQRGHVVSPCPHDLKCPMLSSGDHRPCNFSATYTSYPQTQMNKKELYSYVILRKGRRSSEEPNWPRVVREILSRHKHCICRMCTPEGKLAEVIFTPTKHGKITYKCTRQSKWGDRLPISIKDNPKDSEISEKAFSDSGEEEYAADCDTKEPTSPANSEKDFQSSQTTLK